MTVDGMEMPSAMSDLLALVEREIPDGRQSLRDSFANLEKVADYCEDNYFRAENKRLALEETKNYTTQSLASVAYQINTLAYNLLHMLELQASQMADMESQMNHISETVAIHKEKVARREIGVLTTNKVNARQHKILVPANPERAVKYIRKPVDFSLLDEIGHGVKLPAVPPPHQQLQQQRSKRGSIPGLLPAASSSSSSVTMANGSHMLLPAPTTKPPTPPQAGRSGVAGGSGMGTLSRGSKEYRTPAPPIAPPQVPSNYAPNFPIGGRTQDTLSRRGSSGYSATASQYSSSSAAAAAAAAAAVMRQTSSSSSSGAGGAGDQSSSVVSAAAAASGQQLHQVPQIGTVHPMSVSQQQQHCGPVSPSPTPPPPPPPPPSLLMPQAVAGGQEVRPSTSVSTLSADCLPLPPPLLMNRQDPFDRPPVSCSPPLPPPPPTGGMQSQSQQGAASATESVVGPAAAAATGGEADWIPRTFLEKVIAIYDYGANRYDELSFQENAVIYVVKKNDDGWYEGVLNGITGLFPGNYVEPCL